MLVDVLVVVDGLGQAVMKTGSLSRSLLSPPGTLLLLIDDETVALSNVSRNDEEDDDDKGGGRLVEKTGSSRSWRP